MLETRKLETRSMYRSVRYRINRDSDTRTADPSLCNFRIKRNSCMQSTLAKTNNSNFNTMTIQFGASGKLNNNKIFKPTYLESFSSMMETNEDYSKRKAFFLPRPQTQRQSNKLDESRNSMLFKQFEQIKNSKQVKSRVIIPNFQQNEKEVQQSQHHILAPFNTPFSHVKYMYSNAQNQLKDQKNKVNEIKAGLRHINNSQNSQLSNLKNQVEEHIQKFRRTMRKNEIQQQQKKLRTKRQLQTLTNQHTCNKQKFKELSDRSSKMQKCIFNSTPYDLKMNIENNNGSDRPYSRVSVDKYQQQVNIYGQIDRVSPIQSQLYI